MCPPRARITAATRRDHWSTAASTSSRARVLRCAQTPASTACFAARHPRGAKLFNQSIQSPVIPFPRREIGHHLMALNRFSVLKIRIRTLSSAVSGVMMIMTVYMAK